MRTGPKPKPIGLKILEGGKGAPPPEYLRNAPGVRVCGRPTSGPAACKRPAGWGTPYSHGPCRDHTVALEGVSPLDPPEYLPVKARELWEAVAPELARTDRLKAEDVAGLTMLTMSYHFALRAAAELITGGVTMDDPTHSDRTAKKSPAWQIFRDASNNLRQWANEFGLTPSSRTRFSGVKDEGPVSEMERLLGS